MMVAAMLTLGARKVNHVCFRMRGGNTSKISVEATTTMIPSTARRRVSFPKSWPVKSVTRAMRRNVERTTSRSVVVHNAKGRLSDFVPRVFRD